MPADPAAPGEGHDAAAPGGLPTSRDVPGPGAGGDVARGGSLPGAGTALRSPDSAGLPADVLTFDGPFSGDPLSLLPGLRSVLSRPGPAVVVATSGSTGHPKRSVLTTEALTASGRATERATSGPGQWLLCLPAHYVAGLQVLARSVLAGTQPVVMPEGHFTATGFARAAAHMSHDVRYVSVVPTQLQRILDPQDRPVDPEAVAALARFDAVLVGGSALSPALAARAREAGVRVVTTYGMSETCGGCVYDGRPLDTVRVRLVPEDARAASADAGSGRIWLGGDVVAAGYLDDPRRTAQHFREAAGMRWYRTDDLGEWAPDGTLRVLGRTDDVINTGGVKVSAAVVAGVLETHQRVRQALVLPVPDPQWGQRVAALVVPRDTEPAETSAVPEALRTELAELVRTRLGGPAVPRLWRAATEVPLLPTGKPDRAAATRMFG